MNPTAKKFFEDNPHERYWYFNTHIRVPNPRLRPWLDEPRDPWPTHSQPMT